MRIVNVMISRIWGGVEQAFLDYTQAMLQQGHTPLLISDSRGEVKSKAPSGTDFFSLRFSRYSPWTFWQFYRKIKAFNPDVIITHSKKTIPILRLVANRLGVPLVAVAHNDKYRYIGCCDAIFSITEYQKEIFIQHGYPAERIFVIPNCINADRAYTTKQWHNPPVLGTMGRFDPMKGFDVYLKALARLKQKGIAFKAVLGGGVQPLYPHEQEKFLKIIRDNQLQDDVQLIGWVKDKYKFYNDIDIFVLSSNYEPFGIVLLEAMSASVPVITSDAQGPSEIFKDCTDTVYMFHKNDAEELADRMILALQNPQQTEGQARRAWNLCQEKYTLTAVAKQLDNALQNVKLRKD